MEEKKLDELLNEEMIQQDDDQIITGKIINKRMNQRILKKSLITSISVVVITICLVFGLLKYRDYVQEKNAFHLSDWEMVVKVLAYPSVTEEQLEVMNAYAYINSYVTLFCPGYIVTKDQIKNFEHTSVSYGTYEIEAELINLFEVSASDSNVRNVQSQQSKIPISWSNIWIEELDGNDLIETRYQSYHNTRWSLGENVISEQEMKDMKEEVEKLPETSIIMLDITVQDAMTLTEILEYQKNHVDSRVVYVTTHVNDEYYVGPYGFNLMEGLNLIEVNYEYKEIYPYLTLNGSQILSSVTNADFWSRLPEYDEEVLTQHYLSCMKLLVNNGAAKWYEEDLVKIIKDVEDNGVEVHGYRIYATKEDALELFEDDNVKTIVFQDVKLSKYQK